MEETYRIIQPNVAALEKKLESLFNIHDKYKSEILQLPNNIYSMTKYDDFSEYDKKELVE